MPDPIARLQRLDSSLRLLGWRVGPARDRGACTICHSPQHGTAGHPRT